MEIKTRDFGPVEIEENSIFTFPEGIFGFEEETSFALFVKVFDDVPFLYLQSTQNQTPCFLVFEPGDFFSDYAPRMQKEDLDALGAKSIEELSFLLIANVPGSIKDMSLNVKSPMALNHKSGIGRQVILENPDYALRYQPFLKEEGGDL